MRPFSLGASTSATSMAVVHSWRASIVGVTRLQSSMRVKGLTSRGVASVPVPKRHINFFSGRSNVPPAFLKLWRVGSFLFESVAKRTKSGSVVNV